MKNSNSLRDSRRSHKEFDWFRFFAPKFVNLTITVGLITRIVLLFIPPTVVDFSLIEWIKIFALGAINDGAFALIALAPALLIHTTLNNAKYQSPWKIITGVLLAGFLVYSFLPNNIFVEYGAGLHIVARALAMVLLSCFVVRLFVPNIRKAWCKIGLTFVMGLYVFLIIINALSECFFWFEFGVRYNFIAVDYLIYTKEVVGNIMESYPIIPMFIGVLILSVVVSWRMFRKHDISETENGGIAGWLVTLVVYAVLATGSFFLLHFNYNNLKSNNNFATELQCNGCWNFLEAFNSNTLEYDKFYEMIPQEEAEAAKQKMCGQDEDGVRAILDSVAPIRKNIVLITVESLSADFLTEYGSPNGITPNLDTLIDKSLVFDNLYAAGNRSVRGLEALTLCIPPSAGESIIKRKENANLYSTSTVLKDFGYTSSFIYGGDSYFDNMGSYFSGNGFEVLDKSTYDEITFSNIWGTCDEDSYKFALKQFDEKAQTGNPFHALIFTISNHRPYTFPEGKIEFDGEIKSRNAAVKYTDYAIGQFFKEASKKPWFKNTVFIVTADHCASSAGNTNIPVDRYHIPALVYAPGFIEPQRVEKLCSQIDLMPTIFSLLHFTYDSKFYGQNILADDYRERAFLATYQNLGYYADDVLTVLSPIKRIEQFDVTDAEGGYHNENIKNSPVETLTKEAQAFYQTVNLDY